MMTSMADAAKQNSSSHDDPMEVDEPDAKPASTNQASEDEEDDDDDDDDSSTSTGTSTSSDDEDNDDDQDTSSEPTIELPKKAVALVKKPTKHPSVLPSKLNLSRQPPKMRIKLSLKLPTKANRSDVPSESSDDDSEGAVKATVVGSDDEGGGAMAAVVTAETTKKKGTTSRSRTTSGGVKRRSTHPSRPIKMPPLNSPGLLMLPPHGGHNASFPTNKNGYTTPAAVFQNSMSAAGYSLEQRTKHPHRGSSVQRVVDDMFDSNVELALHFPPLLPSELLQSSRPPPSNNDNGDKMDTTTNDSQANDDSTSPLSLDLPKLLLESLEPATRPMEVEEDEQNHLNGNKHGVETFRKRRRPWAFKDMIPVSLTMTYPSDYNDKRLEYVRLVQAREKGIIAAQEAEELDEGEQNGTAPPPPPIPPIPEPPSPPALADCRGTETTTKQSLLQTGGQPVSQALYIPRGRESFLAHLDPQCFHITDGRYFGLYTNGIADPNFCGANAPGITGVNASGGAGLATSTTGTTSATALTLRSAAFQHPATAVWNNAATASSGTRIAPYFATTVTTNNDSTQNFSKNYGLPELVSANTTSNPIGPKPTATLEDLRNIFQQGGPRAESLRRSIVRLAVHAARCGRHGQSFVGADGETYPDVSKAFEAHAGIKPCLRCKNNQQESYHCRLRRQHKGKDYDGGSSVDELIPLFAIPMDKLMEMPSN